MDGIAWASSAMVAARTRLDVAGENLANVSSGGFSRLEAHGELTPFGVVMHRTRVASQGALERTGRDFDLAILGRGSFRVAATRSAPVESRDGRFVRERDGTLSDIRGRTLLGANGSPLVVPDGARIDERGRVVTRDGTIFGRLPLPAGSSVHSGFLESAGVDAIAQMIDVLAAERAFESAQKAVTAIDRTREKSASEIARVK